MCIRDRAWGFGLWLKVGPALSLVLSLLIFWAVQVPWSLWWLKRHERGPMEALWGRLTYGRPARPAGTAPAIDPCRELEISRTAPRRSSGR